MIQLRILNGPSGSSVQAVTAFPCKIGRSASSDIRLEQAGVWDQHAELDLDASHRVVLKLFSPALAAVNGAAFSTGSIRNGDGIELGAARLQLRFTETHHKGLQIREGTVWFTIVLLTIAQVALIYSLLS